MQRTIVVAWNKGCPRCQGYRVARMSRHTPAAESAVQAKLWHREIHHSRARLFSSKHTAEELGKRGVLQAIKRHPSQSHGIQPAAQLPRAPAALQLVPCGLPLLQPFEPRLPPPPACLPVYVCLPEALGYAGDVVGCPLGAGRQVLQILQLVTRG